MPNTEDFQAMSAQLEIKWSGDVPGLSEHRLSIAHFNNALNKLLVAYRRIASNMMRETELGATGGANKRLRAQAKWLDLEITEVLEGSTGLSLSAVMNVPAGNHRTPPIKDLAARAGIELLEAIRSEVDGQPRSPAVRSYLNALPKGISSQLYSLRSDGQLKQVEVGDLQLAKSEDDSPHLLEIEGTVKAVGFDPGFVRVEGPDRKAQFTATEAQIDEAIRFRGEQVVALGVGKRKTFRLLKLRRQDRPPTPLTPEQDEEYLFARWDGLLKRLAE